VAGCRPVAAERGRGGMGWSRLSASTSPPDPPSPPSSHADVAMGVANTADGLHEEQRGRACRAAEKRHPAVRARLTSESPRAGAPGGTVPSSSPAAAAPACTACVSMPRHCSGSATRLLDDSMPRRRQRGCSRAASAEGGRPHRPPRLRRGYPSSEGLRSRLVGEDSGALGDSGGSRPPANLRRSSCSAPPPHED
jgi:hypothetical protein